MRQLPGEAHASFLTSLRNVDGLPIVIVVAEAEASWLGPWYGRVLEASIAILLLWIIAGVALRYHWAMLAQRDHLWEIANIDALTGVASRRHFLHSAQRELDVESRLQHGLALMMLDIDFFKQINDSYGHACGDRAIVSFSQACKRCLRNIDLLGRIGGDEFAIVLPAINETDVRLVAERLCQSISAELVPKEEGSKEHLKMTASIGVVVARAEDIKLDALMARADLALYQAKTSGRNTYVMAQYLSQ